MTPGVHRLEQALDSRPQVKAGLAVLTVALVVAFTAQRITDTVRMRAGVIVWAGDAIRHAQTDHDGEDTDA